MMEAMRAREESRWADGFASGSVYNGDPEHIAFLNEVYALNSQANPLHADLWPSTVKFEAEIVAMAARMLGDVDGVCGTVSSGGTESILLAMKVYRDRAYARGITAPEMITPVDGARRVRQGRRLLPHHQGDGAGRPRRPGRCRRDGSCDHAEHGGDRRVGAVLPEWARRPDLRAVGARSYARDIGFHTDACLGGFVLPWAERLGYDVPPFDFRVPGVTSMSADTHKYGYAAKGTSVVLYRDKDLRHQQYYRTAKWAGGLYFSPTFAGSRPGALSAACWAAMLSLGEEGYLDATRRILEAAQRVKEGLAKIDGVDIIGDPLWNVAFTTEGLDVYRVLDVMGHHGWSLNGLQDPPSVHLCVTLRHTQPGVVDRFLADLAQAVETVRADPQAGGSMAPIYGMATMAEMQGTVEELLEGYVDLLFEP